MKSNLLLGVWQFLFPIPRVVWQNEVTQTAARTNRHLEFMSERHHRVRDFVVRELPRVGKPLTPEFIAQAVNLTVADVIALLDDLEKHKTFLFRNRDGAVSWAYPVTVDVTPHRVTFDTGERVYAA